MINTKSEQLYRDLVKFLNTTNPDSVKRGVRNSVNNNRVLTVNQVVTFLKGRKSSSQRTLGRKIERAYSVAQVRNNMRFLRGSRTDAYDINEFRVGYLIALAGGESIRKSIGHKIG